MLPPTFANCLEILEASPSYTPKGLTSPLQAGTGIIYLLLAAPFGNK
jgi:hypothetical protein